MSPENDGQKVAILGFGNPVREDDGIGIYVINELKKELADQKNIEIFDLGTAAFEVLFKLRGRGRIILIDAVINSGHEVGAVFKLPAEDVEAKIVDDPMVFLHGLKWDQALSYSRKILGEEYPKNIDVFLIAIQDTRFDQGISNDARRGGDQVIKILCDEFKR